MLREYMLGLGYTSDNIDKITNTYPTNKLKDETLFNAVNKIYNFFLEFGYTKEQIKKMLIERPQILCLEISSIENKIDNFKKIGFSKKIIIKITTDFPTIYSYGTNSILTKVNEYERLGYKREVIIKNAKKYPELFGCSMHSVRNKIEEIIKLGFSYEDVIKITSKNMSIINYTMDNIKNKISSVMAFDFNYQEVINMIKIYPSILNFTIDNMQSKIFTIISLGYTHTQTINIIKRNPALFGERPERIKEKKLFYDSINLFDIFLISPGQLKQSIELSYARYMFFNSLNIELSMEDNSYKELFIPNKRFETKYKISKEELIKKYNYSEVKNSGRVI